MTFALYNKIWSINSAFTSIKFLVKTKDTVEKILLLINMEITKKKKKKR